MKFVFKAPVGKSWTNLCTIETEEDWNALSVWLGLEQIEQLKREGTLVVDGCLFTVTSDRTTIEYLTNIAPHYGK